MESYIVSARKYRPQTFNSVVGQLSITQTLKSAVKNKQLAHAYLFCGPRGVGKTTCARIFAKTINCFSPTDDNEPCNECESCLAFNSNRSYNIHELDAASNNSVEDIRNLIEQVRIPPRLGKYSVYIIDEVHMLSSAAFNAFLKTLEEPPAHAVFVLATTEKHKILATILSRCQVFDFNRIRIEDTVDHLRYVAKSENIITEDQALRIIAQKADGGMRDALSIFDQLVSFTDGEITYQKAIDNLNILDYEFYFKTVDNILANQISELMLIFDDVIRKGFDGLMFVSGLSGHFRNLLMSKNPKTARLVDSGADMEQRYLQQATSCSTNLLFGALQKLRECELNYKISKNQRLHVELTLMDIGFYQFNIDNKKKNPGKQVTPSAHKSASIPEKKTLPIKPQTQVNIKKMMGDEDETKTPTQESKPDNNSIIAEPVPETEESPTTVFDIATLADSWIDVIQPFEPKTRLYIALKASNPQFEAPGNFKLTLKSEGQAEIIEENKKNILSCISKGYQIPSVTLEYEITAQIDIPKNMIVKKPNEVLSIFIEKNPAINLLIEKFNLEVK
ncbi:MAG: DNA polymerase III subunit gamma/tau [Salinivirgaceae bacterium]|nr:DNA polymerase III subunit gamma/tau [Salinivirgaceae bacterium]